MLPDGRRAAFAGDGSGRLQRVTGLPADLVGGDGRVGAALVRPGPLDRSTVTAGWSPSRRRPEVTRRSTGRPGGSCGSPARRAGGGWSRVGPAAGSCAVRSSDGRTVRYRYDGAGDLVEVGRARVRAGGATRSTTGSWWRSIDADGVELVRNAYDPEGRVRWQRSPFGRRTTFRYPGRGVTVVADDEGGPTVTHLHDPAGRLVGVVDDHGARVTKGTTAGATRSATVGPDRRGRQPGVGRAGPAAAAGGTRRRGDHLRVGRPGPHRGPHRCAAGRSVRLSYRGDDREPSSGGRRRGRGHQGRGGRRPWWSAVTDPDGVATRFERDADGLVTARDRRAGRADGVRVRRSGGLGRRVDRPDGAARFEPWTRAAGRRRTDADGTAVGFEWTDGRTAGGIGDRHRGAVGVRPRRRTVRCETVEDAGGRGQPDGVGRARAIWWRDQPGRHDRAAPLRRARPAGVHRRRVRRRAPARVRRRGSGGRAGRTARAGWCAASTTRAGGSSRRSTGPAAVTRFEPGPARPAACRSPTRRRTTAQVARRGRSGRRRDRSGGGARPGTAGRRAAACGRSRRSDGAVTRYRYDRAGRLVVGGGSRRAAALYERDAAGRVVGGRRPGRVPGPRSSSTGAAGCVARTEPCGDVTRWTHHPTGRVASVDRRRAGARAGSAGTRRAGWCRRSTPTAARRPTGGTRPGSSPA